MAVIIRRLFGIGKLSEDFRAQVEAEGLIYLEEYVPVTRRFTGTIPGVRASHSVASYPGALAFTQERVLGTLSSLPKLAGRAIDVRWDAPHSGAATAEISSTGVQVDIDVAKVDPRFHGDLSLHFKADIPEDVLARLPLRSFAFDVPPEYVFRAVGVTYSP
ncbi:hypothetical protein [Mycobacterium ulcerans]|uniref:Uncharacterized protein n=1 Tax=Mycobacterium ulcerans subsp. shinshuense TaxID=1124626 RepID=A0A1B4Y8L4_MYCUL|nr:hypothetical protein [Mycobacterium ulcerans]BAV43400.1 hypothetical protein SHTP_4497 [Mycobacterium ulcerans subsp. shinshuense]